MASIRRAADASAARRRWPGALLTLALGLSIAAGLVSPMLAQSDDASDDVVTLEGSHDDLQFLAGRTVRVSANVADDVFAAGRNVTFDGATASNAVVAGYDVEQRGGALSDMIAAGAIVTVAGTIQDDLVAAARSLRISSAGAIGGDARLAGETIDIEGRVGGSLRAAARRITVAGDITGKADLFAERIIIASGATIAGDLIYRGEAEPEIADGATIGGEVRQIEVDVPDFRSVGLAILGIGLLIALSWAIASLVVVIIVQVALPGLMTEAAAQLQARPLLNLGRGVAILIVANVLAGALLASILGIPIGVALLAVIGLVSLLGLTATAYWIGLEIRRRLRGAGDHELGGRIGWTILGAVILGLVALIPVLGAVIAGLAVAAGCGSAIMQVWQRLRPA